MNEDERLLVFSTKTDRDLKHALCGAGDYEKGETETHRFPDGEHYLRVLTSVDGRDVVIVGGTATEADTLELFDLACGVSRYGARRLTLVVPYFGCSTMDRAVKSGEVVTAKNRARLLSAIPPAAYGNRVFLVDLHTDGLPHYFDDGIRAVHVYGRPIVTRAARRLGGDDFVLACTDAGRAKWVESLANQMGVQASFVLKRRLSGSETEVSAVSAQVEGRRVVIYDDMIRTGSSLLRAAEAYMEAGAVAISAVATHGVFPGDALDRIRSHGLFERIAVTESHPRARELAASHPEFLEVLPLAALLVRALDQSP